jgi:hypothetical protein
MQSSDLSGDAVLDEPLHVGHFAGVHERADDLPIRRIPPYQENLGRGHGPLYWEEEYCSKT